MVRALRLVYFGTPAFAVPTLDKLLTSPHDVVAVVTQPDRPRGRGHKVVPEAVKVHALAHGLTVLQPEKLKDAALLHQLRAFDPDLAIVAAYGRILPADLLALPRFGFINVHASLLPRWRGAAPVHRAILAGDTTTGVTIMRVVPALDAGPMLAVASTDIGPNETSAELECRLSEIGADLLVTTLDDLESAFAEERAQDGSLVTYASRLERRDSQIDWARPAQAVHDQIRGLQPWPLAAAVLRGRRMLFIKSEIGPAPTVDGPPGQIVALEPDALIVATQPGSVRIREIQPEGRPPMSVRAFLSGHHVVPGDQFSPVPVPGS
jgi:methionyl-tRNA formyltransferase